MQIQGDFLKVKFERESNESHYSYQARQYRTGVWIPADWDFIVKIPPTGLLPVSQQAGAAAPGGPALTAVEGGVDLKLLDLSRDHAWRMGLKTGARVAIVFPRAREFRERTVGRLFPPYVEMLLPASERQWYGSAPEWWLQSSPNIIAPWDLSVLQDKWAREMQAEEQERQRSLQAQASSLTLQPVQ